MLLVVAAASVGTMRLASTPNCANGARIAIDSKPIAATRANVALGVIGDGAIRVCHRSVGHLVPHGQASSDRFG